MAQISGCMVCPDQTLRDNPSALGSKVEGGEAIWKLTGQTIQKMKTQ